ncbi:hypothetical protein [Nocardioides ungokensis]|uniref:hypothetical protein n=1 Tax=Nocardioides ungokensis TaxID=1643322 RepID=UPI0015DE891A|nr:hypothetical protein [Nocardioides ungokensis]
MRAKTCLSGALALAVIVVGATSCSGDETGSAKDAPSSSQPVSQSATSTPTSSPSHADHNAALVLAVRREAKAQLEWMKPDWWDNITGYEADGTDLTVKTSLFPKASNAATAKKIAASFSTLSGSKGIPRGLFVTVKASNGDPLATFEQP